VTRPLRLGDPLPDEAALARRLQVSREAVALARACEIVDLHLDTFIPVRLWGYDPTRWHGPGFWRGRFFGHLDFPRAMAGGLAGGMWSITTNPFRPARARWRAFLHNLARLRTLLRATGGRLEVVRTHAEYTAARSAGAHAALLAIQGGNALAAAPDGPASIPDNVVCRVTLVHLTSSLYGETSSPLRILGRARGLTDEGRDLVRALDVRRIFVDLAHLSRRAFWDAVEVHDRSRPLLVTHTGVSAVCPSWRNLDDDQIRAVAESGGTVGILFASQFLRRRGGPRDEDMVLEHLEHILRVAGEDFASLGSDYDGAITPPPGLRSGEAYPRLVQKMLERGWKEERIRKVLGLNFLRALRALRPE
jgi:membrane dipeptidase